MRRPTAVTICGQPFTITWQALGDNDMGETWISTQRLTIDTELGPHAERDTVLHEVLHAIARLTGHRDPEPTITATATALLAVLRDNPGLVAWLLA